MSESNQEEFFNSEQLNEILSSLQSEEIIELDMDKVKAAWDQVERAKLFGKH